MKKLQIFLFLLCIIFTSCKDDLEEQDYLTLKDLNLRLMGDDTSGSTDSSTDYVSTTITTVPVTTAEPNLDFDVKEAFVVEVADPNLINAFLTNEKTVEQIALIENLTTNMKDQVIN